MSNIIELIDAYAAENAAATHAAMNYGRDSALYSKYSVVMLEARTAVVEAVEKLEKDAARLERVIVMHPDDPAIKHLDGVLVYVQRTLPKREATNGQDH